MRIVPNRTALVAGSLLLAAAVPTVALAAPNDGPPHHPVVRTLDRVEHLLDNAATHPRLADRDLERARAATRRLDTVLDDRSGGDHDPRIDAARTDMRQAETAIDNHNVDEALEDLRQADGLIEAAVDVRTDPTAAPDGAVTQAQ